MPPSVPIKRRSLVKMLRKAGFEGPMSELLYAYPMRLFVRYSDL